MQHRLALLFACLSLMAPHALGDHIKTFNDAQKLNDSGNNEEAFELYQKSLQGSLENGDTYYAFFNRSKMAFLRLDEREYSEAADIFLSAFEGASKDGRLIDGGVEGMAYALFSDGFHASTALIRSGRISEAISLRDSLDTLFLNHLSNELRTDLPSLTSSEIFALPDKWRAQAIRMRSIRADILDLMGQSVAAAGILSEILNQAEESRINQHSDSTGELIRCAENLGLMVNFLGRKTEAREIFNRTAQKYEMRRLTPWGQHCLGHLLFNQAYKEREIVGPTDEVISNVRRLGKYVSSSAEVSRLVAKLYAEREDMEACLEEMAKMKADAAVSGDELVQFYAERLTGELFADDTMADLTDDDFIQQLRRVRELGVLCGEPTVYRNYGDFLLARERYSEAVIVFQRAYQLSRDLGWTLHLPALLARQAEALDHVGQTEAADRCWSEIDSILATTEGFEDTRIARILQYRLTRAMRLGDRESLVKIHDDLTAILAKDTLSPYQKGKFEPLSIDLLLAGLEEGREMKKAEKGWSDLQPVLSHTLPLKGLTTYTIYTISNPTVHDVVGRLTFTGSAAKISDKSDEFRLYVELENLPRDSHMPSHPLVVKAKSAVEILVETPEGLTAADFQIDWQPTDGSIARSTTAGFQLGDGSQDGVENNSTEASTASVLERSEFYAVPLSQVIQFRDDLDGEQAFRLVASRPCYIVVSGLPDGVTAIDANGNGEFQDAGDILEQAISNQPYPVVSRSETAELKFHVFANRNGERIELDFQLLDQDGEWKTRTISWLD